MVVLTVSIVASLRRPLEPADSAEGTVQADGTDSVESADSAEGTQSIEGNDSVEATELKN